MDTAHKLVNFYLAGGSVFHAPIYFLLGYIISCILKAYMALPWHLSQKQFFGLVIAAFGLLTGFILIGNIESDLLIGLLPFDPNIHNLAKPIYSLIGLLKADFFFAGYMLPFYLYKKKLNATKEYQEALKKIDSVENKDTPGW